VVEANLLASRAPERARGLAFNIGGGGTPTTVNQLLMMIGDQVGVVPVPTRAPARPGDIRRSMADVSLARDLLGFSPLVDIAEGVRRTVEWFKARPGLTEA
jgi:UDP-glucose 4-epimerase